MQYPQTFNNEKRYVFTNWTTEDFTCSWDSQAKTIAAGAYLEMPEYLAYHFTKHLVDREMHRDGKEKFIASDEQRDPYEKKTMSIIADGVDSPALNKLKEEIRKEVEEEQTKVEKKEKKTKAEKTEFADIKK